MGNCCNNDNSPTTDIQVDTETHIKAKKRNRIQNNTDINSDDNYSDTSDETETKPIKGKKGIFKRNKKPKLIPMEQDESFIESSPDTTSHPSQQIDNNNEYNNNNENDDINIDTDSEYSESNDTSNNTSNNKQIQQNKEYDLDRILTKEEELLILAYRMYTDMDIKDRKWNLKTYKQCFLGNKCVDWLINNNIVMTRNECIQIGQQLIRMEYICHVNRKHDFKDAPYYYKFINPIQVFKNVSIKYGSMIQNKKVFKTYSTVNLERLKFVDILKKKCKQGFDIKDRKYRFKLYPMCFIGEDACTWMVINKVAQSRNEAVEMGQLLINNNIIQHVTKRHKKFKDDKNFYEFIE